MVWSLENALRRLNSHAVGKSTGNCAAYTRQAINAGGIVLARTPSAKDYGPNLQAVGFEEVSPPPVSYKAGDVVVIQSATGHPTGHMAMFNGEIWVSDFKQAKGLYPGEAYRKEKPVYRIYRYPSN
jgi:hypothetical protein